MMSLIELLDTKFYPDYKNNWDDDIFRDKILKNIRIKKTILVQNTQEDNFTFEKKDFK